MSDTEKLHIRLGISGTYWDKKPQYRVLFNDQILAENFITGASDEVEYLEFDVDATHDLNTLGIELLNKEDSDVKKDVDDPDDFQIIADMVLYIVSLEIDEIDIGNLRYSNSEYHVDGRGVLKEHVTLGWNGVWRFSWTTPFYIWLLENI